MKSAPAATFRELYRSCYPIFEHAILMEIVRMAPSPNAADEHVLRLGFGNDIARMASQAVSIRQMLLADEKGKIPPHTVTVTLGKAGCSDNHKPWQEVVKTNSRSADRMFAFEDSTGISWRRDGAAQAIKLETSMKIGGLNLPSPKPVLGREIALYPDRQTHLTTFDGEGTGGWWNTWHEAVNHFERQCGDLETITAWMHDHKVTKVGGPGHPNQTWYEWSIFFRDEQKNRPTPEHLEISFAKLLRQSPNEVFPRFLKQIRLLRLVTNGSDELSGFERIHVYLYMDTGPSLSDVCNRGFMVYEEVVPHEYWYQNGHVRGAEPIGVDADVFRACYNIDNMWRAQLLTDEYQPRTTRQMEQLNYCLVADRHFRNRHIFCRGYQIIDPLHFYKNSRPVVEMEAVIGNEFLNNPPASLRSLLLKDK